MKFVALALAVSLAAVSAHAADAPKAPDTEAQLRAQIAQLQLQLHQTELAERQVEIVMNDLANERNQCLGDKAKIQVTAEDAIAQAKQSQAPAHPPTK